MSLNVGSVDRVLRLVIGVLFILAKIANWVGGGWGWALAIIGVVLIITALVGYCPLYGVCGISTSGRK